MPRKQVCFYGQYADMLTLNSLDTEALPSTPCHGIRSNILYPTYVTPAPLSQNSC